MDLYERSLTRDQLQRALGYWHWLDIGSLVPMWASRFGAIFLNGPDAWWFLDPYEGQITREWDSPSDLAASLASDDGAERYLARGLVEGATALGLTCGPSEVFSFEVFPVFGAPAQLDNVRATRFMALHAFAGQVHLKLQSGVKLSHITVDGRLP